MSIFAPYNFVPLNDKVWFPNWDKFVSHDVPFKNGISGKINFTLHAHTPIFVRGSVVDKEVVGGNEYEVYGHIKNNKGRYIIPSTSFRGVVRNVHEILSYSKLVTNSKRRLSVRDVRLREYSTVVSRNDIDTKVSYGWLTFENNEYYIREVEANRIDDNPVSAGFVPVETGSSIAQGGIQPIRHRFEFKPFNRSTTPSSIVTEAEMERFRVANTYASGKTFKNYDDIQVDLKSSREHAVFIINHNNKRYLGLCKYMRIAYERCIEEMLTEDHKNVRPDLTELIFGYVQKPSVQNENKSDALKSRIRFSNSVCLDENIELDQVTTVLGSPNPGYYPTYIEQRSGQALVSYNKGQIRGFKRYPVHKIFDRNKMNHYVQNLDMGEIGEDVKVRFIPLKEGIKFKGTLRFENLHPIEFGSLLSSLTFHGYEELYHNIGMAKPLGYGKVRVELDYTNSIINRRKENHRIELNRNIVDEYLTLFEKALIESRVTANITEDSRWKELFTMSSDQSNEAPDAQLRYMSIAEHSAAKREPVKYLKKYSQLSGIKPFQTVSGLEKKKKDEIQNKKIEEELKRQLEAEAKKQTDDQEKADRIGKLEEIRKKEHEKADTYKKSVNELGVGSLISVNWKDLEIEMGKWCRALHDNGAILRNIKKDKKFIPIGLRDDFIKKLKQIIDNSSLNSKDWKNIESSLRSWTDPETASQWVELLKQK
ncbi:MAG: TIGR03986 family CRISPR-associated RAMP protein [Saprospiraceae bacterium]|uniref:TIGR03986 family CRISPR-associated RAMP protein n=1 Tax=Candidatus Opimibacter skivensis TaxID=2982028 RepID=A0A9D7XPN2_9BACT|nr:TIGR03986 family CRISPR-associated RAMP protein [Candidatus Opimibacter skivensis]